VITTDSENGVFDMITVGELDTSGVDVAFLATPDNVSMQVVSKVMGCSNA